LSHRLTESFATKCLSPFELFIFKTVFKNNATTSSGVSYWTQQTLARFLQLPENPNIPIAHVLFQLVSYIGAFPFPSQAPAILTNEALLKVVVVLTGRHTKVLRGGRRMWEREIWRGLAVFDRSYEIENDANKNTAELTTKGHAIDASIDDIEEQDDDDELTLAAFAAMDATEVFKAGEMSNNIRHAMVPPDNFLTLIMFLLLIAPLAPQESPSKYTADLNDERLEDLRSHAHAILMSFGIEKHPGITYSIFLKVISNTLPHLLDPLQALFEHFFFSQDFDLHQKRKGSTNSTIEGKEEPPRPKLIPSGPLLPSPCGDLLTLTSLSHLSFILPPPIVFRNLSLLYSGSSDGFSMPTFQNSVFNWQGPTLVLVSGTVVSDTTASNPALAFMSTLPYRRLRSSTTASSTVTYGAFVSIPWKQTHKTSFGTKDTILFQLQPQHDVLTAAKGAANVYFSRPPSTYTGIGFGSPIPEQNQASAAQGSGLRRRSSTDGSKIPLGPVSLHMDDSLTYAAFTHDSRGGGTFNPSQLPKSCRLAPSEASSTNESSTTPLVKSLVASPPTSPTYGSRTHHRSLSLPINAPLTDWQDVFEIESLEIYGLGGKEVADEQLRAKQWEEREAERRRGVNLRTGDIEADRELLKLAGLIGENQSGGSMG
jgi:hypothetical protein